MTPLTGKSINIPDRCLLIHYLGHSLGNVLIDTSDAIQHLQLMPKN